MLENTDVMLLMAIVGVWCTLVGVSVFSLIGLELLMMLEITVSL